MSTLTGVWVQDGALGRGDAKGPTAGVEALERQSAERSRKSRPSTAGKTKSGMEALRARSSQRAKQPELPDLPVVSDIPPPKSRDGMGRQFTVGNVGHGGMIFLKPVERTPPRKPAQPSTELSPTSMSTASPATSPLPPPSGLDRTHTASSIPPVPPLPAKHISPPKKTMFNANHQRSFSQSTIDARLANEKVEPSTMKIIIDRKEAAGDKGLIDPTGEFPSLRVSIPTHRLGSPRFSARGTALWRGSIYTMSSVTGDYPDPAGMRGLGGDLDRMLAPQTLGTHAVLSRRHSHASPQPYELQTAHGSIYTSIGAQAYLMPVHSGPISPQMFDSIAADPHNPSIVHYSPINGEILAATAARLITQITSSNFLDYELLSDFFLTVRSYMTTHDLLAYMMARFEWAINRFDDNGRVIRVRAFAALRHWILNYFSYDFVVDRQLRVQLCERLNALTKIVKARAGYGASDLKLISDLKKCWNGRCSGIWGSDSFPIDTHQDADIVPGGTDGDTHNPLHQAQLQYAPMTVVPPQLALSPAQLTAGTPSIANWYSTVMETSAAHARVHARQSSDATSRSLPLSPTSEHSVPVLSCTIPARTFRRAFPFVTRAVHLHPIPANPSVHPLPPAAATAIANGAGRITDIRKVSGGAEAVPEQASGLNSPSPNLLRGYAILPSSPIVYAIPTTPGLEISLAGYTPGARNMEQGRKGGPQPPVKSFLGNIRRALSSRYTAQPALANGHNSAPALGKSAQVPFNVVYQASTCGHLEQYRGTRRIDLLGQETYDAYQRALYYAQQMENDIGANEAANYIGVAIGNEATQSSLFGTDMGHPYDSFDSRLRPPEFQRKASTMTEGSQSIVIFDDTQDAHVPPVPRINTALDPAIGMGEQTPRVSPSTNRPIAPPPDAVRNDFGHPAAPFVFPLPPLETGQRLPSFGGSKAARHTQASSISLRRYASFQSTLSRSVHDRSLDGYDNSTVTAPMLRRRPGGDLRANQNVHDLEPRRPKSAGSITTYTESNRESFPGSFGDKIQGTFELQRPSQQAVVALAPGLTGSADDAQTRYSLVPTHSSMPEKRRPSFEAAVAEFAQIPDDDEGGIEATLLKLEGRYISPNQSPVETRHLPPRPSAPEPPASAELDPSKQQGGISAVSPIDSIERGAVDSAAYAPSEGSFNPVPLLERGADGARPSHHIASNLDSISIPPFSIDNASLAEPRSGGTRRGRFPSTALTATTDSFLLDEDDDFLSDLSSDLSLDTVEAVNDELGTPQPLNDREDHVIIGHQHPPSPPMTKQHAMKISSETDHAREQRKPPTPDTSPVARPAEPTTPKPQGRPDSDQPQHMPFVLGFEAEMVAQQLTILEQEALREVDWRDLVDMRWQSTATSTNNWVEYLATQDPIGIDLVTARFNIMVKWALSEIVLTENVEERALTIMKYIHIAHSARQMHNYATLLQITIALTSPDCTRLGRTWNLVPESDKEILQDLEMLVSPKKNFHNLRTEMERVNADDGCIPVLALYTHDLIYNAQKPAQIPSSIEGGEPLINFERFRSTAVIVKNLLRMIDASAKYQFTTVNGLLDRCLWMAALPDDAITSRSKQLEFT